MPAAGPQFESANAQAGPSSDGIDNSAEPQEGPVSGSKRRAEGDAAVQLPVKAARHHFLGSRKSRQSGLRPEGEEGKGEKLCWKELGRKS